MTTIRQDMGWTGEALDAIEMALGVAQRFGAALSDDDLSHVPTFGTAVDLIATRT